MSLNRTRRKTDDKDAFVVAELCRRGLGSRWRVLSGPFAAQRILTRRREQLVQHRRRLVNRLHRHRDVVFPELRELFPRRVGRTSRWVLRQVATPAAVLEMGIERLCADLYRVSRGQLGRARGEAMVEAALRSVGVAEATEALGLAITQLLDKLEEVLRRLAEVERRMKAELERVAFAGRLLTVPGFGAIMVATLVGEFGDLRDYRVARQLIKMAGLDLVEDSSGERQGHHHISRRGRRYARQMLYMAGLVAGRVALSGRRRRLVEEKNKPAPKAAIANACALLRIAHALVRDEVAFDAARHTAGGEVAMAA